MDTIRYLIGKKADIHKLPKKKGQIIVVDTREIYADFDDETRIKLGYSTDEINFILSSKLSPPVNDGVFYGIEDGEWKPIDITEYVMIPTIIHGGTPSTIFDDTEMSESYDDFMDRIDKRVNEIIDERLKNINGGIPDTEF